jgi:hypothetical protein
VSSARPAATSKQSASSCSNASRKRGWRIAGKREQDHCDEIGILRAPMHLPGCNGPSRPLTSHRET